MKRLFLACFLLVSLGTSAQQYALYNTKTLFDAFENPARKVYTQDTSRQFTFSFLPSVGISAVATGQVQGDLRRAVTTDVYATRDLDIGKGKYNYLTGNVNIYVGMLRIYTSVLNHGELGLSWQIRSDNNAKVTNETMAIFDTYKLFDTLANYSRIFNNHVVSSNYQQFGITYRQNVTRLLGVGMKLSYLSGMAYNELNITHSSLGPNYDNLTYELYLDGSLRSSFRYHDGGGKINYNPLRNPGMAVSAGFTRRMKYNWTVAGQVKDAGFIYWRNKPVYSFNGPIALKSYTAGSAPKLGKKLDSIVTDTNSIKYRNFISPLRSKAEIMLAKEYDHYRASLFVSKNLLDVHGDAGLVQNVSAGGFNAGISTVYSSIGAFQVGGMLMYKTRGIELFGGSDHVLKMKSLYSGISNDLDNYGSGYNGASIYLGIGISFGRVMDHPWYSNRIPGF